MTEAGDLFDRVVAQTGLAAFIGPGLVRRALQSVGVSAVDAATPEDYRRALPAMRARMGTYLPSDEAEANVRAIAMMLK